VTTLLLCCGAVAREVIALREKHGWDADVQSISAALHNRPERIPVAVKDHVTRLRGNYEGVLVIYGDCGTGGALDRTLDGLAVDRIAGPHCYEQFAGAAGFEAIMEQEPGTLFLTDFLARSFDHLVIEGLGLDANPELREDYFRNYQRVVYLQQQPGSNLERRAEAAAESLGLPLEIHASGYGEFETRLVQAMSSNGKG
jgi:hypothetical protein